MAVAPAGYKIWVKGIVQGVGFRPFVYSLALENRLTGWVRNTSSGVEIEIAGQTADLLTFIDRLTHDPPPLARLDQIVSEPFIPTQSYPNFSILASQVQAGQFQPISPDMAICVDCQREMFNPDDRRYRYPFINCTNCGPRFSIIRDIPYDRPKTTMADFTMCPNCQAEYENPLDRRFHAQPTACPVCGPQVWLQTSGIDRQKLAERDEAIHLARAMLKSGKILAVKGLGGYLLACDAANSNAVDELRRRKKRSDKPFALMAFDLEAIRKHCLVEPAEEALLLSRQQPVVLLQKRLDSTVVSQTAPNQNTLGVMLAYTPLHLLLLEPEPGFPDMLVMTSANLSEEPIAYRDEDALTRLAPLADAFLLHDRPIHMRVDDSVVRIAGGQPYLLRRARGYAPDSLSLPFDVPQILATGAELKNTFCLTRQNYAFLSHHIGDLENYETLQSFEEGIRHYESLFRIQPEFIACDLHPDYLATRYARQRASQADLPLIQVQHHHAHLAACLVDNGWNTTEPVIGLSFDGTGLGTDGAIWGGEVLLGNYREYERIYHLSYVPLAGGDLAVRKPARMALAHLWQAGLDWEADLAPVQALCYEERLALRGQLEHRLNSPLTSSMGRLFDAAAALMGVQQTATYEGQAAIEMEALVDPHEDEFYSFEINADLMDPAPLWQALLTDWRAGLPVSTLAARFHNSIVKLVLEVCTQIRTERGVQTVALSGGVWQNKVLYERTLKSLQAADFHVLVHRQTPTNDGCIALGQAVVAASVIN